MGNLDNQFLGSTEVGGLVFFQIPKSLSSEGWSDWRRWPHFAAAMDLGGDGLSGSNAFEHFFFLCFSRWPDFAHGANRDIDGLLKALGLSGFIICMMVTWNSEFGPDKEHGRRQQRKECLLTYMSMNTPESAVLFKAHHGRLVQCFKRKGYT